MENASYYYSEHLDIIRLKNRAFTYAEHNHVSVYTIGFVFQGEAVIWRSGHYIPCSAPGFFVIAPYQVHALLLPDSYDMVSICIHEDVVATHKPHELSAILSPMLSTLEIHVDFTLLYAAISEVYRCETLPPTNQVILSSATALRYHPESNLGLQGLAKQAHYSPTHYLKKFKQYIGMTPHKFQMQSKVRKAQRMLEAGETSTDAALILGFYDQSHFDKCFRRIVGLTPTEYRKAAKRISSLMESTQRWDEFGE